MRVDLAHGRACPISSKIGFPALATKLMTYDGDARFMAHKLEP